MRPLYEIDQEILDCVDMETGEILDTERLDALQMERERKLEGVALWVKDLKAEAAAVKEEADKLKAREKSLNNKIDGLKNWLLYALNGEKMKTPRCNVYYTHSQRVAVADEGKLIEFLEMTSNFLGMQYIIATHSPLLLGMSKAKILNLDEEGAPECSWAELENIRILHDFFAQREADFK